MRVWVDEVRAWFFRVRVVAEVVLWGACSGALGVGPFACYIDLGRCNTATRVDLGRPGSTWVDPGVVCVLCTHPCGFHTISIFPIYCTVLCVLLVGR